jgi:cardiolipin synthase
MPLPLQPDLRPHPPWFRRAMAAAAAVAALLVLGSFNGAQQRPVELVLSGPEREMEYARAVERLIAQADKRVWVMMYVMQIGQDGPTFKLANALAQAAKRGVAVQVCLDMGNVRGTEELDAKHAEPAQWLQARGVKVVIDELDRTSHSKVVVVDSVWSVVGSHNWTFYAMTKNREASVILRDADVAKGLESGLFSGVPGWNPNY